MDVKEFFRQTREEQERILVGSVRRLEDALDYARTQADMYRDRCEVLEAKLAKAQAEDTPEE